MFDKACDFLCRGYLMVVGDFFDAMIKRATENAGKGDGIVDLVRKIASSCGNNGGSGLALYRA